MKKRWGIIAILEVIVVCIAAVLSVRDFNQNKQEIVYEQSDFQYLSGGAEAGFYIDTSIENFKDVRIGIGEMDLPTGSYDITVQYQCLGLAHMEACYCHGRNDYKISGSVDLSERESQKTVEIMVDRHQGPVTLFARINSECGEGDYLLVDEATISSTFSWYRLQIFKLFLFILFLDLGLWLFWNKEKVHISVETRKVLVCLGGIAFLASLPLMASYMISADQDIAFHLTRIEGLKEGLMAGEFPVKIQPQWLNGHGYPVSVFYGDLLLYFPALLRIAGVSLESSYKLFVLLMNIATAGVSYSCFKRISGSWKTGVVASFFYTLNLYRLTNLYVRVAVGEYSAILFFPIILFGLWYIFTQEIEKVKKNKVWILLALGYLGILYSHLISCEMAGIFTIFICLLQIRKVFQKERFLALLKAFIGIVVGGLAFMLPMLQYMQQDFVSGNMDRFVLYRQEERGLFWGQFFVNKYDVLSQSKQTSVGMAGEMPLTLGIAFLVLVFAVVFTSVCCYQNMEKKKQWFIGVVLLAVSMWICTKNFPFGFLAESSEFLKLLVNSLQYPWRFLAIVALIATLLLTWMLSGSALAEKEKKLFMLVVCTVLLIDSVSFMSDVMNTGNMKHYYDGGNLDSYGVSGGEYLFNEASIDDYVDQITEIGEGVEIADFERGSNEMTVQVSNFTEAEQTIELPLILYKGYQAKDIQTKEELYISAGKSHRITLHIPAGYEGSVEVKFSEPWYWRVAEMVSLAGAVFAIVLLANDKRKAEKKAQ